MIVYLKVYASGLWFGTHFNFLVIYYQIKNKFVAFWILYLEPHTCIIVFSSYRYFDFRKLTLIYEAILKFRRCIFVYFSSYYWLTISHDPKSVRSFATNSNSSILQQIREWRICHLNILPIIALENFIICIGFIGKWWRS